MLTVTALPNSVLKMMMTMLRFRSSPSSQPRKPVEKQLRLVVALIHMRNMTAWFDQLA